MKVRSKVAGVLAATIGVLGLGVAGAASASAHDNTVSGVASCDDNGTHSVVWTITNDYNLTETSYVQSFANDGSVSPTQVDIGKNGSGTVTQSGITKNVANINIHSVWSDDFKKDDTGHVKFTDDCQPAPQHTTVDASFTEGSVSCVEGQASYVEPSFTKSGDHVSWVVDGTAGFGNTVTLTASPDKGYVIDGKTVFTHTFDAKPNAPDCRGTATPVSPTITEPVCTGPGTNDGGSFALPENTSDLKYTVDGNTVYVHVPVVRQGDVRLADNLPDGWVRDSDVSAHFVVVYTTPKCLVKVKPVIPFVNPIICTGPGTHSGGDVVLPTTEGIVYTLDGTTVTATLVDGYRFPKHVHGWTRNEDGSLSTTVVIPEAPACLVQVDVVNPTVTQSVCKGGKPTAPVITPGASEGIVYDVKGNVVTATLVQGYEFGDLPTGWNLNVVGDNVPSSASFTVTLTTPDCTLPTPTPKSPVVTPTPDKVVHTATLAFTGLDLRAWGLTIGALLLLGMVFVLASGFRRPRGTHVSK